MSTRTSAERLDLALDELLTGDRAAVPPDLRPLLETATKVRAALPPLPVGVRFEERLGARLGQGSGLAGGLAVIGALARHELRHPSRLVVTGAVSSAALGLGLTAIVVWRGARRHAVVPPTGEG